MSKKEAGRRYPEEVLHSEVPTTGHPAVIDLLCRIYDRSIIFEFIPAKANERGSYNWLSVNNANTYISLLLEDLMSFDVKWLYEEGANSELAQKIENFIRGVAVDYFQIKDLGRKIRDKDSNKVELTNLLYNNQCNIIDKILLLIDFVNQYNEDFLSNITDEVARTTAPKPMPTGQTPAEPETQQDLTARGTPRKIAPKRMTGDLANPKVGFDHPDNSLQAHFSSKADKDVVERFNRFCKEAPGLKQGYVTQALEEFLEKYDPKNS